MASPDPDPGAAPEPGPNGENESESPIARALHVLASFFAGGGEDQANSGGRFDSELTLWLGHGESIAIGDDTATLPGGTVVTVTETECQGYQSTHAHGVQYNIDGDTVVEVTNRTKAVPGLSVTKRADRSSIQVGETVTYTVTVKNTGNTTLTGITVTDTFDGAGQMDFHRSDAVTDNGDGSFTIAALAPGAEVTITASYTAVPADEGKTLSNTAVATAGDGTRGEDTEHVPVDKDEPIIPPPVLSGTLRIQKTVSGTGADWNGSFQFLITLSSKISGSYDGVWFDQGQAVVTIQAGQTLTITGLPYGTRYTVTELDSGAYTVTSENAAGTIGTPNQIVYFHNHLDGPSGLNTEDHYAYLIGFTDGTIRPEASITRAEVATIFFRLLTDEARERYWSQANPYSDVAAEDWYNNAISTLTNMGILEGKGDGAFHPLDTITKAEFATIAVRFFDHTAEYREGTFVDVDAAVWYADYVQAAADKGLIEGNGAGYFEPMRNITRAEAATIVNRTLGRRPHEDHLLLWAEMIVWPDNANRNAWYYEAMQEATNSHDYVWTNEDSESVEQWTGKLPERDWAALEQIWSNANSAPGGEVMEKNTSH